MSSKATRTLTKSLLTRRRLYPIFKQLNNCKITKTRTGGALIALPVFFCA